MNTPRLDAIKVVENQLEAAVAAKKCHACGCLASTLEALGAATEVLPELGPMLAAAECVLVPQKYECLGCQVCFPAAAANALAEAYPGILSQGALCPTDAPEEHHGWPPLPGDYAVLRYGASVAVCTLNSDALAKELAELAPDGLAIVGTMHTENLGVERVIRNVLANPNIRWLLLCGEDTRQLVGHLPGQSMESLCTNGIDESLRIIGAKGKRPYLKNISREHIEAFKRQVELVSMIGNGDDSLISQAIIDRHRQGVPPFEHLVADIAVETVISREPQFYKSDPAGFLLVYPDYRAKKLVAEHYTNAGQLDVVVEGATPTAVYSEVVKRGLLSQFDHAAYLGRELANAAHSLQTGQPYVQDRAPGKPSPTPASSTSRTPADS